MSAPLGHQRTAFRGSPSPKLFQVLPTIFLLAKCREGSTGLLRDCDAKLNPTVARSPAPAFHLHRCLQSCGQREARHAPQGTLPTPMAFRHHIDVENTPLPDSSGMLHVDGNRCPWGESHRSLSGPVAVCLRRVCDSMAAAS